MMRVALSLVAVAVLSAHAQPSTGHGGRHLAGKQQEGRTIDSRQHGMAKNATNSGERPPADCAADQTPCADGKHPTGQRPHLKCSDGTPPACKPARKEGGGGSKQGETGRPERPETPLDLDALLPDFRGSASTTTAEPNVDFVIGDDVAQGRRPSSEGSKPPHMQGGANGNSGRPQKPQRPDDGKGGMRPAGEGKDGGRPAGDGKDSGRPAGDGKDSMRQDAEGKDGGRPAAEGKDGRRQDAEGKDGMRPAGEGRNPDEGGERAPADCAADQTPCADGKHPTGQRPHLKCSDGTPPACKPTRKQGGGGDGDDGKPGKPERPEPETPLDLDALLPDFRGAASTTTDSPTTTKDGTAAPKVSADVAEGAPVPEAKVGTNGAAASDGSEPFSGGTDADAVTATTANAGTTNGSGRPEADQGRDKKQPGSQAEALPTGGAAADAETTAAAGATKTEPPRDVVGVSIDDSRSFAQVNSAAATGQETDGGAGGGTSTAAAAAAAVVGVMAVALVVAGVALKRRSDASSTDAGNGGGASGDAGSFSAVVGVVRQDTMMRSAGESLENPHYEAAATIRTSTMMEEYC